MPETWRQGSHSGHNLYLQTAEQPSDTDRQIGAMFDPAHATAAVEAVNAVTQLRAYAAWCLAHDVAADDRTIVKILDGEDEYDYSQRGGLSDA